MRKIALVGFDNLLAKCLELVLKNILNESTSICPVTEEKIRKDYAYDFIILHADKATPDSSAISLVRELRKNKCLSPIIALVFSEKNVHNIFSKKAHKLLKYPILKDLLKDTLERIKKINEEEIEDFYKLCCDREYLVSRLSLILHHAKNHDWEGVRECIHHLEICKGTEITNTLHNLLKTRVTDEDPWKKETNRIRRIFDEL